MRTVIKLAGALLEDDAVVQSIARQVAELAKEGHEILVVIDDRTRRERIVSMMAARCDGVDGTPGLISRKSVWTMTTATSTVMTENTARLRDHVARPDTGSVW